jgi:NitT/TauT family transport system substrate-binding protein
MAALTNPWVAQKEGIFQKNGLDVKLVEFRTGNEAIAALQGGSVDIVLSIPGTAMTAIERGFDLVAIGQNEIARTEGPDSGSLQVLKDSPIQSVKDLAGKKVGVSSLHSQNTVGVQKIIKDAGVDLKSVQFLELPFPAHADALRTKQIDAVATVDPYTTQLQANGLGRVLSWNYVESIPEQPLGAWFAKSAYIKRNPKVVDGFAASIRESIEYMNADPERARAAVVSFTGLKPELVKDMPLIKWDYRINPAKWQAVIDLMRSMGELQKPHKAADFISDRLKPYIVN